MRARISSFEAVDWAKGLIPLYRDVAGGELQLWAAVHSPGAGTVAWTSSVPDLVTLEEREDKLSVDSGRREWMVQAATHTEGDVDYGLFQHIHGDIDPNRELEYLMSTSAVVAGGQTVAAMSWAIELCDTTSRVTGVPMIFGRDLTGPASGVTFSVGYANIRELQAADEALAGGDESYLEVVDRCGGYFQESAASVTTMWRRVA